MSNESVTTETTEQTPGSTTESTGDTTGGSILTEGGEAEVKQEDTKQPEGAPEAYDLKLPEGADTDAPVIEEFKPLAKELGLTNEKAQKLVDFYTEKVIASKTEQFNEIRKGWVESAKADKEYGGAKFGESVTMAKKAMDQFGTPELRQVLDQYGIGDHPEMVRLMVKVGQTMAEDKIVSGAASMGERDPARIMFPNMK